jgi:hypothetical protein
MEDDPTVTSLIRSNLLLNSEFNGLYLDILKKSKELLHLVKLPEDRIMLDYPFRLGYLRHAKRWAPRELNLIRSMLFHKRESIPRARSKEVNEAIFKLRKEMYTSVRKHATNLSGKIQSSMSSFEDKTSIELSILSSTTMHVCKKCSKIISLDKFKKFNCNCEVKITKISQVSQIPIHHFNDRLINFLDQNYWLEHGVDYLLRRKNLQTLVGYHVLGHSGVWHEIDNIADSKNQNYRIFCECKNAEIKVNDIFVFSGKMIDVGCTRGYVFTTSDKVSDEIIRLGRSKNIDIITGTLTRDTTALLKNIKEV